MASDLTFSGERFLPDCAGEIAYEHWHRYAFARRLATGKVVLDAACGEGYGTALLAAVASAVTGVDIDATTVEHARHAYGDGARVRFIAGSCTQLPLPDASFDLVVSFETIEHLVAADQPRMLGEFARVLKPEGVLLISSPNKRLYSEARSYVNEFHLHELYRDEFAALLTPLFPTQHWYHQRVAPWSTIWKDSGDQAQEHGHDAASAHFAGEAWLGDADGIAPYTTPDGMYFIVVAARNAAAADSALADPPRIGASFFTDRAEVEQKRAEANAREVLRLDGLLGERDTALARQTGHIQHLESLVAERERVIAAIGADLGALEQVRLELVSQVAGRDRALAASGDRAAALESSLSGVSAELENSRARLADQDRTIAEREAQIAHLRSFRGWLALQAQRVRRRLSGS